MGGKYLRTSRLHRGFTIVEIVVVVAVIGILASITVVSYSQTRINAENTKTLHAVEQYIKAVTSYATRNGAYPISATHACLGSTSSCARVLGSTMCFTLGTALLDSAFAAIIATEITPAPEPSSQTMNCSGNQYKGAYYEKNDTTSGKTAMITYFLRGNQVCSVSYGTVTRTQQDDTTRCGAALPTLP
jgi:prepilin-type N-terminal cleavage/methylation domain-containing protein